MTTYVYFCVTEGEIEAARTACSQHGCPDNQIKEFGPGKTLAYEGDMNPLFDENNATVVVGFK